MITRYGMLASILTFVATATVAVPAMAQSRTDGSIYSRFALGERQQFHSPQSQAMGGGALALSSLRYINAGNPASWYNQQFVRGGGSMTFQQITASAEGFQDSKLGSGQFTAVQIGFPLLFRQTGVAFSFAPYTRVNYRVDSQRLIEPSDIEATPYTLSFQGNGGLQRLTGGVGHKLTSRISVGASVDYLFGILEETQLSEFNSDAFQDRTVVNATRLRGVTSRIGFRYSHSGIGNSNDAVIVAVTVSLPTALSGERVRTLGIGEEADTLDAGINGDVDIPLGLGIGVAWQPTPKWILVADTELESWSTADTDFSFPGFAPDNTGAIQDRVRFSAGAEYWPGSQRAFAGFFSRMAYRFGFYSESDYASPIPSESIRSIGITGGLSIPSQRPGTTIDLNVDVGRRGTTDNGLIRDRYLRIGLNLNFGERWFNRLPLG